MYCGDDNFPNLYREYNNSDDEDWFEDGRCRKKKFIRSHQLKRAPCHTEDDVPIRKLYISNVPSNVTQRDLSKAFGRFGEVQECQLVLHSVRRPAEDTYSELTYTHFAFVTFARANDAHAALSTCWKISSAVIMRGVRLIVRAADTWHQPNEPNKPNELNEPNEPNQPAPTAESAATRADTADTLLSWEADDPTILDVLDRDCLHVIFGYLAYPELIRSERVSKRWCAAVRESIASLQRLSTAGWRLRITTTVLRGALRRVGAELRELHIVPARLNSRAMPLVSRLCPRLERLRAVEFDGTEARGFDALNALARLSALHLSRCEGLSDDDLALLLGRKEAPLLELRLDFASSVSGAWLAAANAEAADDPVAPLALRELALCCIREHSGCKLSWGAPRLESLARLHFESLPNDCWLDLPAFLDALPNPHLLRDLSLMDCTLKYSNLAGNLASAVGRYVGLNRLRLACNSLATDEMLTSASRAARGLEWLDVSSCCNVSESALVAALERLRGLRVLDVSSRRGPLDAALEAASHLPYLSALRVRDAYSVVADDLAAAVRLSGALRELDVRGTRAANASVVVAAVEAAEARRASPPLELRLSRSGVDPLAETPSSNRVRLDWSEENRAGCFKRRRLSLQSQTGQVGWLAIAEGLPL